MVWVISIIVAVIVSGAVFFVGAAIQSESAPDSPGRLRGALVKVGGIVLLVLWVGLQTAATSIHQVEAGHVGVVYQFGSIVGQRGEGLQFIAPWRSMRTASVQVQRFQFERMNAFSQETQDVFITATLNYSISPNAVQKLYRDVGANWFDRLVEARANNFFKEETVKYQTVEIAPNREKIRATVRERLTQALEPYSVTITDLLIDNIDFREEFKQAIENKQIAAQDALREQERIRQKEAEAKQQIATAEGKAEAVKIEADGQAAANKALAQSLTPELIQFQALQKLAPNVQIALLPSGQGIIIDPATLLGGLTKP